MSEAVRNISETVAKGFGKEGAIYMAKKYTDIIHPSKKPDRTAEEIIDDMKRKLERF